MIINKIAHNVAPGLETKLLVFKYDSSPTKISDGFASFMRIQFSASGQGVFELIKNGEVLARLYNSSRNLNPIYEHGIFLQTGEKLEVSFTNLDQCAMDMHFSCEAFT